MPALSFLVLLAFAGSPAPVAEWRFVYPGGVVESARPAAERRQEPLYAWAWSDQAPPRRLEADRVDRIGEGFLTGSSAARLRVRVSRVRKPGTSKQVPVGEGFQVIAAPLAMWQDLPEDRLPAWPVPPDGALSLPYEPGERWRLRLLGRGEGSWWIDLPAGSSSAVLTPAPAADFTIALTAAGARTVEGAVLRLSEGSAGRDGEGRLWASYRSESGRLRIPALPDAGDLIATLTHTDYAPAVLRGRPGDLPSRLALEPGSSLSGRFTNGTGSDADPVRGVRIRLESWIQGTTAQSLLRGTESGADGRWSLAGIPAGPAALWGTAPGFVPFRAHLEAVPGRNDLGTVALRPGVTLQLRAVDDRGEPVAGATLEAGPGRSARTDARGRARLAGVDPEETLVLTGRAPRHLEADLRLAPPLPETARLRLPRAFSLRGRLLGTQRSPVGEGKVQVLRGRASREQALDSGGTFDLDLEPGEAFELVLLSPETRELRLGQPAGAPGETRDLGDLSPPPGLEATGRVVDDADGTPVPSARVWLPRPSGDGDLWAWLSGDLLQTRTREDGGFRLSGLPETPALLRIDAGGFARTYLEMSPRTGGSPEAGGGAVDLGEIRLRAGARLLVVAGPRAEGATARLDLRNQWIEPDMLTRTVRDGEAVFRHVPPGPVTVSVLAGKKLLCEQELTVPQDAGGSEISVDCPAGSSIVTGSVREGGVPAGPGYLVWHSAGAEAPGEIDTFVTPGGLRRQQVLGGGRPQVDVEVAADGSFRTEDLTPGRWEVLWSPHGGALTGSQQVQIPPAERFETVLDFEGIQVTGTVADREGKPVESARVRDLSGGSFALSAADGSFSLAGVPAGRISLQARLEDRVSSIVEIEVEPRRRPDPVSLVLDEQDARIEIRVLNRDGAPAAGAFVFFEEEGKGQRLLTAGTDGRAGALIDGERPRRARAAAWAGGAWTFGSWASLAPPSEPLLSLTLPGEAGTLRIETEKSAGSPRVVSSDGWDVSALLLRLGLRPTLSPDAPLRLDGLPPGNYSVLLDGSGKTVTLEGEETVEIRLE